MLGLRRQGALRQLPGGAAFEESAMPHLPIADAVVRRRRQARTDLIRLPEMLEQNMLRRKGWRGRGKGGGGGGTGGCRESDHAGVAASSAAGVGELLEWRRSGCDTKTRQAWERSSYSCMNFLFLASFSDFNFFYFIYFVGFN